MLKLGNKVIDKITVNFYCYQYLTKLTVFVSCTCILG